MTDTNLPFPVHFGPPPHRESHDGMWTIPGMGLAPPTLTIATWYTVTRLGANLPPLLSLRGLLPGYIGTTPAPMMALEVDDGYPVPKGAFDAAVAWLDAHRAYTSPGPVVACWLGQSRSVVFASVWLARRHKVHLTEAFQHVCEHHPGAAPNAVLVRSAYEWMGFKVPQALR